MKLDHLPEPELQFGAGKHPDIRFGLLNYGPHDLSSSLAPKTIRLGLVGTPETIEGVQSWLDRCRKGVQGKPTRQPNLFPRFPGFGLESVFRTEFAVESRLQRQIPERAFCSLAKNPKVSFVVEEASQIFLDEICHLTENTPADVILCALPMSLLDAMERTRPDKSVDDEPVYDDSSNEITTSLDFHHLLKARAMDLGKPIQLVLPMTYDESKRRHQKAKPNQLRTLQDEATRAWSIHVALYYKAGGTPWRLARDPSQLTACYVGISFFKTLDESKLMTSVAQVFNERGNGIIVRGGPALISREDRQPHLQSSDAFQLLDKALKTYRAEHGTLPARVVLHKTSRYNRDELDGFEDVISQHHLSSSDILSVSNSSTRLFRGGAYPPLRGMLLSLDDESHVLVHKGKRRFFCHLPRPVRTPTSRVPMRKHRSDAEVPCPGDAGIDQDELEQHSV